MLLRGENVTPENTSNSYLAQSHLYVREFGLQEVFWGSGGEGNLLCQGKCALHHHFLLSLGVTPPSGRKNRAKFLWGVGISIARGINLFGEVGAAEFTLWTALIRSAQLVQSMLGTQILL